MAEEILEKDINALADLMVFLGLVSSMILLLLSLLLRATMEIMDAQRKEPVYIITDVEVED